MKKVVSLLAVLSTLCSFTASAGFIDFNDYTVDSYGTRQDIAGNTSVNYSGTTLSMSGNIWKSISENFVVSSNTMLEFEFFSDEEGEIVGIGFDNNSATSNSYNFQLFGTQRFGVQNFNTYQLGDGWSQFSMNVGDFYTGNFDRMFFVLDDDSGSMSSNAMFRNVQVCEKGACEIAQAVSEPGIFALILAGLLGIRRKFK